MSQVAVSTPFNIFLEFQVAPFYRRVMAWLVDIALLLLYARGMKFVLSDWVFKEEKEYSMGIDMILVSLPMLFYPLIMELMNHGQSIGKWMMGIRVISLEDGEPRLGQYLMRWIFRLWEWPLFFGYLAFNSWNIFLQIVLTIFLGLVVAIIIAVSGRNQRLGDLAAGTTVVDLRYRYSLADTVFTEINDQHYRAQFPEVMRLSDRDINAIRTVLQHAQKRHHTDTAERIADKVKQVLGISSALPVVTFLETLLADYNYLATRDQQK